VGIREVGTSKVRTGPFPSLGAPLDKRENLRWGRVRWGTVSWGGAVDP
jgi:hypothetical protein